jgi:glycogen debranching enzyme
MSTVNLANCRREHARNSLCSQALHHMERLTNGLTDPPMAALPISNDESRPELRLFEALFGRDALRATAALDEIMPTLGFATVVRLAEAQGVFHNASREEEPGRIAHEIRDPDCDPVARELSENSGWGWPYYGAVDATPLFVLALVRLWKRTGRPVMHTIYRGRDGQMHTLEDAHHAALRWILRRMDANPEGLVESLRSTPGGIRNQVWKDSRDAYHHADGTLANDSQGVASIEVQALVHDALVQSGKLLRLVKGRGSDGWWLALECEARAHQLAEVVDRVFWVSDARGPYLALGTDRDARGQLRPLQVRSSNMGHVLTSTLLDGPDGPDKARLIADALAGEDLLAAAGVRTLSTQEVRYRPGGYHVGSVWPWENGVITEGLRRFGHDEQADDLERRVLDSCRVTGMFPEFVRGEADHIEVNKEVMDTMDPDRGPDRLEQPPQEIQAWTVATVLGIEYRNHTSWERAAA